MPFYLWSRTAASNATSDPTINWAEGMSPSAVNDSARAGNARLREFADDIIGAIVTSGTSTAYTVTSYEGYDTLAHLDKQMVAFTPHTTNGATVTLAVDGLTAKPLRYGPSLELQSGMLIQGTPYVCVYNNSDGAFYLRNVTGNPYGVPLGGLLPYTGTTAPNSAFVLPFGQAISRTAFATYFSLVGTTYGSGDGSTTFNVIDLRGRSIFGLDNMGGSTAGRITNAGSGVVGTTLGATGGAESKAIAQANLPNITLTTNISDTGHSHALSGTTGTQSSARGPGPGDALQASGGNTSTSFATTGITASTPLGGSGTALPILPPAMILPFILRVI